MNGTNREKTARYAEDLHGMPSQGRIEDLAERFDRAAGDPEAWEEVPAEEARIERPELEQISIRLPKEDLDSIRRRAARSGVGYTTLIRMILRQHLNDPLAH
ncbi:MAG: hypothetical protein CYG60_18855 [Actinobacteria bacterium]|nr:MAG: hypothetical protein CYG60_18855 [Actinomycetota bacterium]